MKRRRNIYVGICLVCVVAAGIQIGCSQNAKAYPLESAQKETESQLRISELNYTYQEEDRVDTWDENSATKISCNGNSAEIEGIGASVSGAVITISQPGVYVVSGTLNEGQIRIDAGKEATVQLVLNDFSIDNRSTSPIYGIQSEKLILTLAAGTVNQVTEESSAAYEDESEKEPDAAIFSKDDITINGTGALTVNGNFSHGIRSKDDLSIVSGTLTVHSINDGLKGTDSVVVNDATLHIDAGGDGIQSNNDTDPEKGFVLLETGSIQIQSGEDGIQAETVLEIRSGNYELNTTQKALKAGTLLTVSGGTIQADAEDDSIHSNGNIVIGSGKLQLSSKDDGIHADSNVTINGGEIEILTSYEGIEGMSIDILDGVVRLVSSDDGLNAAGGTDASGNQGSHGADSFTADENAYIRIAGGALWVDAAGDGIDSNGDFYLEGGSTSVSGPVNNGNGILDYNGTAVITGGSFSGTGSAGMLQTFSDQSTQNTIAVYYSEQQEGGSSVELLDQDGQVLLSVTPEKNFTAAIISTPEIRTGETYGVKSQDSLQEVSVEGLLTELGEKPMGFGGGGSPGGMQGNKEQPPEGRSQTGVPENGERTPGGGKQRDGEARQEMQSNPAASETDTNTIPGTS